MPVHGQNCHGRTADRDLVKALKPPPRGERFLWDAELTGFAIKIFAPTKAHPRGARTFVLSYWINGTRAPLPDWLLAGLVGHGGTRRGEGDPATDRPR